jgi:8-oxo-dGTP diphosphatase
MIPETKSVEVRAGDRRAFGPVTGREGVTPRYPGPSLAVDAVWVRRGKVLLVRRGRPPFKGAWALPGGFVEIGETVETAVLRELREETGLVGSLVPLLGVYSDPHRDPRKHTVSVVFGIHGPGGNPHGGDDAASAEWVPLEPFPVLAFDHGRILRDALTRVGPQALRASVTATPGPGTVSPRGSLRR